MNTDFENKLTYNGISFQRSNRLSIDEREIHAYHEILFCMDADATLFTEKQQKKLKGDTLILIPKETYHLFRIQDGAKFPRLKIYFPADALACTPCFGIMQDLCIMEKMDEHIRLLLKRLCHTQEEPKSEKQGFYAYSAFLMLLAELDHDNPGAETPQETEKTGELLQIIRYYIGSDGSTIYDKYQNTTYSLAIEKELGHFILDKLYEYPINMMLHADNRSYVDADMHNADDYRSYHYSVVDKICI